MNADLSQLSMRELFRIEAEGQTQALVAALLALEKSPGQADQLEVCMRAAHSLKGAARIVEIEAVVGLAHAMEDVFVAAQHGRRLMDRWHIDQMLQAVDLLKEIAASDDESEAANQAWHARVDAFVAALANAPAPAPETAPEALAADASPEIAVEPEPLPVAPPPAVAVVEQSAAAPQSPATATPATAMRRRSSDAADRSLRVNAESLNQLLDLSGGALVEARRLKPFAQGLHRLKRMQNEAIRAAEALRDTLPVEALTGDVAAALEETLRRITDSRHFLAGRITELDDWEQQNGALVHRLYDQAIRVRMLPFAEGIPALPRMVRDIAHSLGKEVRLEVVGDKTQVDRDILEKLDAPLIHLLRNAVDHGLESPAERLAAGKSGEGQIRLEAYHSAGTLQIAVVDDGAGIDAEQIRRVVMARGLAPDEVATRLSESELLDFLFLPGFSMKEGVTEISGRGVGLDVVHDMLRQVGGLVRVSSTPGKGTRFQLQLPLTLSVTRALLVEIGGEPYAFPFARILRTLKVSRDDVVTIEGHQFVRDGDSQIGLVSAHQLLECGTPAAGGDHLYIVVLGNAQNAYGVVVDGFIGGRELVVQPLDPRLGKMKDISAGALMEDGMPLLIIDVEDMIRSMEKLATADRLRDVGGKGPEMAEAVTKRVLIVDDSFTVRELQRKVLEQHGYEVEVAVDGMDGWNAVRGGKFDLVITDVDMPRMDGIALVGMIRKNPALRSMPVMILSYKDREEDKRRGLDAGADYYLTKGSFQSGGLIQAVIDLVGEAG